MHPSVVAGQGVAENIPATQEEAVKRQQSIASQHPQQQAMQSNTMYHTAQPHIHMPAQQCNDRIDEKKLCQLIIDLTQQDSRETALLELSKHRESCPDLAPILWYSFGAITALLQEVIAI